MKTDQMPLWLVRTLFSGLALVLVLLPFHAFFSTWGGTAIGPLWLWKSWKELLLVALLLLSVGWLATRPRLLSELFLRRLVQALTAYVVFSVVVAFVHIQDTGTDAVAAGLAMNLRYLLAGVLAYLLFYFADFNEVWVKRAVRYVVGVSVFVAFLGVAQALVIPADFLTQFGYDKETTIAPASLIDNNPELLRAFGTLRGPNDFGAFLILPLVLLVAYFGRLSRWVSLPSIAILLWGLVLSSSRSAWLGAVAAIMVFVALRIGRKLSTRQLGAGLVSLVFAGALVVFAAFNVPAVRMAVFHSSPGDPSLTEGSTDNHIRATAGGIERVLDEPLGCGIGCAGPASYYGDEPRISENYAVQLAEETGVIGLVLFIVLMVLVVRRLWGATSYRMLSYALLAALGGYAVIGLLLHVWADDPLSITWWLLAGAVIGYNERNSWIKSKTSSRSKT